MNGLRSANYEKNIRFFSHFKEECEKKNMLVVSAFIDIGRETWEPDFKRSNGQYFEHMKKFILRLEHPMIFFTHEKYFEFILSHRPKNFLTKLVKTEINDLELYPYKERIVSIQNSEEYKSKIKRTCKNNPEFCKPDYDIVTNNKISFLNTASFLVNANVYVWVDSGYGHGMIDVPPSFQLDFSKILSRPFLATVTILERKMSSEDPIQFFKDNPEYIDGGIIVVRKEFLKEYYVGYYALIKEFLQKNIIDDDQYFSAIFKSRNKEKIQEICIESWRNRKILVNFLRKEP